MSAVSKELLHVEEPLDVRVSAVCLSQNILFLLKHIQPSLRRVFVDFGDALQTNFDAKKLPCSVLMEDQKDENEVVLHTAMATIVNRLPCLEGQDVVRVNEAIRDALLRLNISADIPLFTETPWPRPIRSFAIETSKSLEEWYGVKNQRATTAYTERSSALIAVLTEHERSLHCSHREKPVHI